MAKVPSKKKKGSTKKKGNSIKAKAKREVQEELAPQIKAIKRQKKQGAFSNKVAIEQIANAARGANKGTNEAYAKSAAFMESNAKKTKEANAANIANVKADAAAGISKMQASQQGSINEASAALQALGIGGNSTLAQSALSNTSANAIANYNADAAAFNANDASGVAANLGKLMLGANESDRRYTVDANVTERIQRTSDQRLSWLDQKEQFSNALKEIEDRRPKMVKDMIKQLEQEKLANERYKRQVAAYRSYGRGFSGGGYSSGGSSGGSISPYSAMGASPSSSTKKVTINADPGGTWWGAGSNAKSKNSGSPSSWLPSPQINKMKGIAKGTW